LNPKAMDNKTRPSEVYIAVNLNNAGNERSTQQKMKLKIIFNGERNMLLQNFSI
jgi:hypothetical protein